MNRSIRSQELVTIALPVELAAFDAPPLLLPGEQLEHYRSLRQAVFTDIAPQSAVEWLLAIDVAEASWEIQRYRLLRQRLLEFTVRRRLRPSIASTWRASLQNYEAKRDSIQV
jgi:hypothetical protein